MQLLSVRAGITRVEVSADKFLSHYLGGGDWQLEKMTIVPKTNSIPNVLPAAVNPGTFQEMAPLLAMFLWKTKNHNTGIRHILETDKRQVLFGDSVSFGSHLLKLKEALWWLYPEEAQAQPCLLKWKLRCYLPRRVSFHAGMLPPSWSRRARCWPGWVQPCF